MKRLAILSVCVLLVAASASAQSIDKWQLRIYLTGAAAPIQPPSDLLLANVTTGLPSPLTGVTINPNKVGWDDPTQPGRFDRWDDPGTPTSPLTALPFGAASYEATLTAVASTLVGPEGARVAFTRPGVTPAAPTGLRVVR